MKSSLTSFTRKSKLFFTVLVSLLIVSVLLSLCLGAVKINLSEIFNIIFGGEAPASHRNIFYYTRVPRTIACVFTGAALASAGVIIQNVLSNPLASPNLIGVNAGAGFAVLLSNILLPGLSAFSPLISFAGAFAAVLIIMLIGFSGQVSKITLILAGVAVSAIFNAGSDALINLFPDSVSVYADFKSASFSGITLERIIVPVIIITAALLAVLIFAKDLDLMLLGYQQASALGMNYKLKSIILLALASLLSASAVSICGMIGFVGLIVPHIMRKFVGEDSTKLIISSALGGALLVNSADLASRLIFAPNEFPAGILLSFIGGPFFIFLLLDKKRKRNHA